MNRYQRERVIADIIGSKMDIYIMSAVLNTTSKGDSFIFEYESELGKTEKIEVWDYIYLDGDDYGENWYRKGAYSTIMRALFKEQWDSDLCKLQSGIEIPKRVVYDKGPWFVTDTHNVSSEDFTHDVILTIRKYAEALCEVLNKYFLYKKA